MRGVSEDAVFDKSNAEVAKLGVEPSADSRRKVGFEGVDCVFSISKSGVVG